MISEQLKLPLFADEFVEPDINECFKVKFKGMKRAHHIVSIERNESNTIIIIRGLNYRGKSTGIIVRYLAQPGIFDLPFDRLLNDLNTLPKQALIAFGINTIQKQVSGVQPPYNKKADR